MLDKLVSLAITDDEAAAALVEIDVWTDVPDPEVRLRLWDREGRNPQVPRRLSVEPARWELESVYPGCTLTWLVRLASTRHSHFELRLQVFQAGSALPGGNFSYSGPLGGLEERSGRFHFTSGPDKTSG